MPSPKNYVPVKHETRRCIICGVEFLAARTDQIFCTRKIGHKRICVSEYHNEMAYNATGHAFQWLMQNNTSCWVCKREIELDKTKLRELVMFPEPSRKRIADAVAAHPECRRRHYLELACVRAAS